MISQIKLRDTVRMIMQRNNLNQDEFGQSIGISKMMVSYILTGKRGLKLKNVQKLCEVWNIELESLLETNKKTVPHIAEIINDILRIKKIRIDDLSEMTGIDVLSLNHMQRGYKSPSDAELERISSVLNISKELLDEGTISSAFRIIKEQMERLNICDEAIDTVMKYLGREIQNRRTP